MSHPAIIDLADAVRVADLFDLPLPMPDREQAAIVIESLTSEAAILRCWESSFPDVRFGYGRRADAFVAAADLLRRVAG